MPFVGRSADVCYWDARVVVAARAAGGLKGVKMLAAGLVDEFVSGTNKAEGIGMHGDSQKRYRSTEYLSAGSSDAITLSYIAANPRDRSEPLSFADPEQDESTQLSLSEYRAALFGLCQQLDALQALDPVPYQEMQEFAVCFACCFYSRILSVWRHIKYSTNLEQTCCILKLGADLQRLLKSISVFDAGWRSLQQQLFDFCLAKAKGSLEQSVQRELWRVKTHDPNQPIPAPKILDGLASLAQFSPNSTTSLSLLSHSSGVSLSLARGLLQLAVADTCVTLKRLDHLAETAATFRAHLFGELQKIAQEARCVRSTALRVLETDRITNILARVTAVARQKIQIRLKEQIAQNFVSRLTLRTRESQKSTILDLLKQVVKDLQASLSELGKSCEIFEAGVVQCLLMGYFSAVFIAIPEFLQVVERIKIDEQSVIEVLLDIDLLCEKDCRATYQHVVDGLTKPYVLCQVPLSKLHDQEMISSIIKLREKVTKQVRSKKIPTNKQHMYCPLSEAELSHLRMTHKLEIRRITLTPLKDPELDGWAIVPDPTAQKDQEPPEIKIGSHHLNIRSQLLIYRFLQKFRAKRMEKLALMSNPEPSDTDRLPKIEDDIDEKRSAELFSSYLQAADTMQNHFLFGSKIPMTNKEVSGFVSSFGNVQSVAIDPREHAIKQQTVLMELVTRVTMSQPSYDWYKNNMRDLLSKEFSPRYVWV